VAAVQNIPATLMMQFLRQQMIFSGNLICCSNDPATLLIFTSSLRLKHHLLIYLKTGSKKARGQN
jgi:hypothetical protein